MKSADPGRSSEGILRGEVRIWLAIEALLVLVAAYFTILTGFMDWDDEGALMLAVKQYLSGMKIFNTVFSVYGPVYYYYNWAVRTITGTPVSHDTTRLTALLPWIVCCALCAWIVFRLTRSVVAAAATMFLVSRSLIFFRSEPGHPQELTIVLLVGLVASALWRNRVASTIAMGVLAGALFWIKVNIGVFVLAALGLALAGLLGSTGMRRLLTVAAAVVCLVLPPALMWNHLDAGWARTYLAIVMASVLGVAVRLLGAKEAGAAAWRDIILTAGGFLAAAVSIFAVAVAQGISDTAMIDSLVFLPARVFAQNRNWYEAPHIRWPWLAWVALGLGLAIYSLFRWQQRNLNSGPYFSAMKAAVGVVALSAVAARIPIVPVVAPFAWLVLIPARKENVQAFPRTVLCSVSVVQILYGYPVFGSQGYFVQVLLWVVTAICGADAMAHFGPIVQRKWTPNRGAAWARVALGLIVACSVGIAANRFRSYVVLPALDLPGAHLMHVEPELKEQLTSITRGIDANCDAFESLPGLPSFNFWARKEPLTGLNSDAWTLFMNTEQQKQVVGRLAQQRRACAVYNPSLAAFWNRGGEDLDPLPLVHYIREEFRPVLVSGKYRLLIRK